MGESSDIFYSIGLIFIILVGVFVVFIVVPIFLMGAIVGVSEHFSDDRLPPGANGDYIDNDTELLINHHQIVMSHNVVEHDYQYAKGESRTTRIDREDNQVLVQRSYDSGRESGDPPAEEYDNNTSEYTRYSDGHYTISPSQGHYYLENPAVGPSLRDVDDYDWKLEKVTSEDDGWNYSTYTYDGLADFVDAEDHATIQNGEITVRSDGLIVEYYLRGNNSQGHFERRITVNVTNEDVVTEPSWTADAERDEENDEGGNPWECGPNDIDGDGDGLCNET